MIHWDSYWRRGWGWGLWGDSEPRHHIIYFSLFIGIHRKISSTLYFTFFPWKWTWDVDCWLRGKDGIYIFNPHDLIWSYIPPSEVGRLDITTFHKQRSLKLKKIFLKNPIILFLVADWSGFQTHIQLHEIPLSWIFRVLCNYISYVFPLQMWKCFHIYYQLSKLE